MARILCKLLQRKVYDILSKKHTFLILFLGFAAILVSAFLFGEAMMEWSKEKYSVVFSPYSNNIVGKNFRSMLCQYVPVDVVYTWVNGSDPKFLTELAKAKQDYGFSNAHLNCSYSHCVKSHMVIVRPALPNSITLGDLEDYDQQLEHIERIFVVSSSQGSPENVTVLGFFDMKIAHSFAEKKMMTLEGQNYTLSSAYITDSWNSPNSVLLNNVFLMTDVPSGYSESEIKSKFPDNIKRAINKVFIYEEKSLAVLSLRDTAVLNLVKRMDNVTFNNKVASVASAYIVIELSSDHEDISSSRFTDNEELRYSLRSLEKHAPWVQHVYIITNGQIPYWLNLDNPWVSIVTHEEIFPNKSHLPTFSSPAIECHIHRIPNLSKKFLYLNDDVMFGKNVWPEDFYTHTKGQKVYLSWPVPNCAEGCPSTWIRDGYCDKPCNNSQCQWDGGDCTADNPVLQFNGPNLQESLVTSFFNMKTNKNYCNEDCANTWLADRYCDRACNIRSCGFDAGDCGLENYDKMHELVLRDNQSVYSLPAGEYVGYFNLTEFLKSNYSLSEGFYEENSVIRSIAISIKYSVISIVLVPNHNSTNITLRINGEINNTPFEKTLYLFVSTHPIVMPKVVQERSTEAPTEETFTFEEFPDILKFPKTLKPALNDSKHTAYGNVNVSASGFPLNVKNKIDKLKRDFNSGLLTHKGFLKRKGAIIAAYLESLNSTDKMPLLIYEEKIFELTNKSDSPVQHVVSISSNTISNPNKFQSDVYNLSKYGILSQKLEYQPSVHLSKENKLRKVFENALKLPKVTDTPETSTLSPFKYYFQHLGDPFRKMALNNSSKPRLPSPSVTQRHLLDTFGDSLRHVNKLYNEAFGYEARKVPSHIAHFVDKSVMSRLTERFSTAFDVTSSHKIRSSNDMQFAFSYYYFLMSEMQNVEIADIFDMFDTDHSETWSDREIRTVLTRLHDLPLDFSSVAEFEQHIINCSLATSSTITEASVPHNERYYDSKLPLVTKTLICSCPAIANTLLEHFGQKKRNGFEVVGEDEVAFKMIHNNLSQVLGQIDDLRKNPKKFVCLNDNMNHGTQEAEVIRAVIQDFYESMFPTRSSFELPPEYRNRFLYVSDLKEWRRVRDIIRIITYTVLSTLIVFSIISFIKSERRSSERYYRIRNVQNRNRNPMHV